MEYQRVNGIFSEYVFLYHKNLVTDIIVSCENVPNEEVCSLVLKKAYIWGLTALTRKPMRKVIKFNRCKWL